MRAHTSEINSSNKLVKINDLNQIQDTWGCESFGKQIITFFG